MNVLRQLDYTRGQLPELIDVIIEEKTRLFVSAVGVPPPEVIEKLHKAGILIMNVSSSLLLDSLLRPGGGALTNRHGALSRYFSQIIANPKHVKKALDVGVDLICAQAGEGGGHTGDISASILLPAVVDAVKGRTSPLTGQPIWVVGAGAVYDGRGLAANLAYGAQAVWVGTRFVASDEAGATRAHKAAVLSADHGDIVRTLIYTGRPLRVRRTPYVDDWEQNRQAEIRELTGKGIIPNHHEMEKHPEKSVQAVTFMMGNVAALIEDVLPAQAIVDNMVNEAARVLQDRSKLVSVRTKL